MPDTDMGGGNNNNGAGTGGTKSNSTSTSNAGGEGRGGKGSGSGGSQTSNAAGKSDLGGSSASKSTASASSQTSNSAGKSSAPAGSITGGSAKATTPQGTSAGVARAAASKAQTSNTAAKGDLGAQQSSTQQTVNAVGKTSLPMGGMAQKSLQSDVNAASAPGLASGVNSSPIRSAMSDPLGSTPGTSSLAGIVGGTSPYASSVDSIAAVNQALSNLAGPAAPVGKTETARLGHPKDQSSISGVGSPMAGQGTISPAAAAATVASLSPLRSVLGAPTPPNMTIGAGQDDAFQALPSAPPVRTASLPNTNISDQPEGGIVTNGGSTYSSPSSGVGTGTSQSPSQVAGQPDSLRSLANRVSYEANQAKLGLKGLGGRLADAVANGDFRSPTGRSESHNDDNSRYQRQQQQQQEQADALLAQIKLMQALGQADPSGDQLRLILSTFV
ncbi:hypothetical protein [Aestuariivirga sp.]|uniref:hypothetical protein n=1 Tax=Aestuariivirga sp. TaxID=2650926 RepID=UPI0039E5951D